uniref:uncharacterized protein LOC131125165 n=1 Tax=Doryrhamphus excisus TaxID=161450 RepID=UPI0025ADDC6D|nr:uncharacterized protein LOC131125165 [Doryrhamphus excisus]
MWVHLLILLLPACSCQVPNFLSTVTTFYPSRTSNDTLVLRYNVAFNVCNNVSVLDCPVANCLLTVASAATVHEGNGTWCQNEVVVLVNTTSSKRFELRLTGHQWINVINGVRDVLAVTHVDLRKRSDINRTNASPVTTILPVLRVPSNCPRNLTLLTFDPNGDQVRCRYEIATSVLSLSPSCQMTFSASNSNQVEGAYAIQLLMEDFSRKNITVTDGAGFEILTNQDAISQIPVQFVLRVDPPVESCDDGEFVPTFLVPTVANGHYFYATVNTTLNIPIFGTSSRSNVSELLFTGPSNMTKTTIGNGSFVLSWTPSDRDIGQSHPVCFVIEATGVSQRKLHSELRCVFVVVEQVVAVLKAGLTSLSPLSKEYLQEVFLPQLKMEIVERGLPFDITLRVVNIKQLPV